MASKNEASEQISQARYGRQLALRISEIVPNPRNPRRTFSQEALNELAESMKRDGQIQPVAVRRVGEAWELIAGERRWRAAKLGGLQTLAAIELTATDEKAFRLALVENLHREDLSQQEKVEALDTLAEMVQGAGLMRTARELHMSAPWLSRQLSMRKDPVVFPSLEEGRISFTQANELLAAPALARRTLLDRVLDDSTTVPRDTLRAWVQQARRAVQHGRQPATIGMAIGVAAGSIRPTDPYTRVLAALRNLPDPSSDDELQAVVEIAAHVQRILAHPSRHELSLQDGRRLG